MATDESGTTISDHVDAQLIDCTPLCDPQPQVSRLLLPPADTPVQHAMHATLEQTGSGPPPVGES